MLRSEDAKKKNKNNNNELKNTRNMQILVIMKREINPYSWDDDRAMIIMTVFFFVFFVFVVSYTQVSYANISGCQHLVDTLA